MNKYIAVLTLLLSSTVNAQDMDFTSGSLIVGGLWIGAPNEVLAPLATGTYDNPHGFVALGYFSTDGGTGPLTAIGGSNIVMPQNTVIGVLQQVLDTDSVTPATQSYSAAFSSSAVLWNPATGNVGGSGVVTLTIVPDALLPAEFDVTQAVFSFEPPGASQVQTVPEPATVWLLAFGLVVLVKGRVRSPA